MAPSIYAEKWDGFAAPQSTPDSEPRVELRASKERRSARRVGKLEPSTAGCHAGWPILDSAGARASHIAVANTQSFRSPSIVPARRSLSVQRKLIRRDGGAGRGTVTNERAQLCRLTASCRGVRSAASSKASRRGPAGGVPRRRGVHCVKVQWSDRGRRGGHVTVTHRVGRDAHCEGWFRALPRLSLDSNVGY